MNTEPIKKVIEEFLKQMAVSYEEIEIFDGADGGMTRFLIKTSEPSVLIGHDGATILALNHIIRRMAERDAQNGERLDFIVDVNDYQKNKIEELRQKAAMMAERARFFKASAELEPMSSYERMIVHSFLASFLDVSTESVGVGPSRRVVIRYKENER